MSNVNQMTPPIRILGSELNDREKRFVEEYIKDLNGKKAAIRIGVPPKSAAAWASGTINKVAVSQAIDTALQARSIRTRIVQDQVLRELAVLALSDVSNYEIDDHGNVDLVDGANGMAMRAIKKVTRRSWYDKEGNRNTEVSLELWDKVAALKMCGRHLGMFIDRKEITGKDGGPIKTESTQIWKIGDREIAF